MTLPLGIPATMPIIRPLWILGAFRTLPVAVIDIGANSANPDPLMATFPADEPVMAPNVGLAVALMATLPVAVWLNDPSVGELDPLILAVPAEVAARDPSTELAVALMATFPVAVLVRAPSVLVLVPLTATVPVEAPVRAPSVTDAVPFWLLAGRADGIQRRRRE